jgi:hypothetical protein
LFSLAAAAILADACREYPDSCKAWMYRADQAMDAGRLEDAEEYLSRARKLEMNTNLGFWFRVLHTAFCHHRRQQVPCSVT